MPIRPPTLMEVNVENGPATQTAASKRTGALIHGKYPDRHAQSNRGRRQRGRSRAANSQDKTDLHAI